MAQNRSSAVMQQRQVNKDGRDDFPTPPWATRALCEWLIEAGYKLHRSNCREPAVGRGHMARTLAERFSHVDGSDLYDYGAGYRLSNYVTDLDTFGPAHWTITNPPYKLAEEFIHTALRNSIDGVAVLVRTAFLEGKGRHARLFTKTPPTDILQFVERVVIHEGKLSARGSTATAYCWVIWRKNSDQTAPRFQWIEPKRKRLERDGDYAEGSTP